MSLRWRLLLTLVPLFVAGLVISDVVTYASLHTFLMARVDEQLVNGHQSVERVLAGAAFGSRDRPPPGGGSSLPVGTFGELVDARGTILVAETLTLGALNPATTRPDLPTPLPLPPAGGHLLTTAPTSAGPGHYRVYIDDAREDAGTILVVAVPLDEVDATLARVLQLEAVITGGLVLLVAISTFALVRQGLRPLERMGIAARAIVASDLSRRVTPATESTEVGRLGLAINSMLAQIEQAFAEVRAGEQRLRNFVSDASHELRTPLTSMRGYAELLRRTPDMERADVLLAVRRVEEESARMGVLVDDLVLLARLDQGRPFELHPVDVVPLLSDCCSDARVAHPGRSISIHGESFPSAVIIGDEMRMRQALTNLIRNAAVHTPADTSITVSVQPADGDAVIDIIDRGPGISREQRKHIFERLYRADPERTGDQGGSGLGLSIVAAIVAAHGGRVTVHETPGGGATFEIRIPLASPPGTAAPASPAG